MQTWFMHGMTNIYRTYGLDSGNILLHILEILLFAEREDRRIYDVLACDISGRFDLRSRPNTNTAETLR